MLRMRRTGFTLIEMLIVVALIATLMTIVLRLTTVGNEESKRNTTVLRMQKLENCLSGYYAAYGSYPPVKLHNSRDIGEAVDNSGVSNDEEQPVPLWSWNVKKFRQEVESYGYGRQEDEKRAWNQVKAACESQPVALEAPDPYMSDGSIEDAFQKLIDAVRKNLQSGDFPNYPSTDADANYYAWKNGFSTIYENIGAIDGDSTRWRDAHVFKFGLMSFLLPRFQVMMGWDKTKMFNKGRCVFEQWNANNGAEPHDPHKTGTLTWKDINEKVLEMRGQAGGDSGNQRKKARAFLETLPSEAVTARWLPNLSGICAVDFEDQEYFGVSIGTSASDGGSMFEVSSDKNSQPPCIRVYSPTGKPSGGNLYHLNKISVEDGWRTEFFYHSPAPYQSYQLWSAGRNRRTFPPWISRSQLSSDAKERVAVWTEDDIKGMNN